MTSKIAHGGVLDIRVYIHHQYRRVYRLSFTNEKIFIKSYR